MPSGVEKVTNQRDWNESDKDYYLRLVEAAIERGVMPDHDPREPWFLCYSHGDADIDETLNVMRDVVKKREAIIRNQVTLARCLSITIWRIL